MIKINLLPEEFKKKDEVSKSVSDPFSKLPLYPIMAVVFLIVIVMHIVLGLLTFDKKMKITSLERYTNNMQAQFREVENIKKDIATKKDRLRIMESILRREFYLTHFLGKINQAVPKGLWLTRISFSTKGLLIEGSIFSFDIDEVSLANSFFDILKSDSFFVENFVDFNINSVQRRNIKEYEIVDFLLTAGIKKEKKG